MMYSKYSAPKRQVRREKSGLPRKLGLIFLTITTTALILLKVASWLNAGVMFSLKNIEITGNQNAPDSELLSLFDIDTTKSLFEIDLKSIAEKVETHPFVYAAKVSRKLPDNILIKVEEKQPLAILNCEKLSLIDKHGDFLPDLQMFDPVDFPVISNVEPIEKNGFKLNLILNFLDTLKEQNFSLYSQVSEVSYSEKLGVYFYLIESSTPVIVGKNDFAKKSNKLAEVMKTLNRDYQLAQIKYFDLRFKNQVIVKES